MLTNDTMTEINSMISNTRSQRLAVPSIFGEGKFVGYFITGYRKRLITFAYCLRF